MAATDVTREMYRGTGSFQDRPHPDLRVVANLFPEGLPLVLPEDVSIETLADPAGQRVGIAQSSLRSAPRR